MVALRERGGHFGDCPAAARMGGILRTAPRPLVGRRIQVDLHICVGKHDGPDVAPFHDEAASPLAVHALPRDEHTAHGEVTCDLRRRDVDFGGTDRLRDVMPIDDDAAILKIKRGAVGQPGDCRAVANVDALIEDLPRERPIHRARVDVRTRERRRDRSRDGAFPGAGRSIDRNDQVAHFPYYPSMRRRAKLVALITLGAFALTGATVGRDYVRGASLVIQAAGIRGWPNTIASWEAATVTTEPAQIPTRHLPLAARIYRPGDGIRRAVLLVPGVHAAGIEEPRLIGFAEDFAARGFAVVTAELPDLKQYAITPRSTDMIEDGMRWLSERRDLSADGRPGLVGISFGGGLSIVAAGRPSIRNRVAFVLSFGGHGDLPRTLRFLCTGTLADGSRHAPHDYGVVIILLGVAERMVPADQVAGLRAGIRTFLEASHVDMVDKARAQTIFERARAMAAAMPEPSRSLMTAVNDRDVAGLGPRLLPHVEALGAEPALSPVDAPPPSAPVFLLHGADDSVIPPLESTLLADHLRPHTDVRVLLTPLITHAEVNQPADWGEVWKLVSFWTAVLDN
jgi:dienelactone hydrolase